MYYRPDGLPALICRDTDSGDVCFEAWANDHGELIENPRNLERAVAARALKFRQPATDAERFDQLRRAGTAGAETQKRTVYPPNVSGLKAL
jgi:hypothetical protein